MDFTVPRLEQLNFQPDVQRLLSAWQKDPGVQTFLWLGPAGTGKKTYALGWVRSLFCQDGPSCTGCAVCKQVLSKTHPDLFWLERTEGKAEITVEAARELDKKLSNAPFTAPIQVAVIAEADRLNPDAQNALLKTLEEPPAKSLVLLIGEQKGSFIPTVLSRCRIVRFPALSHATVEKVLIETRGWEPKEAKGAALESGGSLGEALRFADSQWREFKEKACSDFDRALAGPEITWLALGNEYDKWEPDFLGDRELTATQRKAEVLGAAFQAYLNLWERRLEGSASIPSQLSGLAPESVLACLQKHQDMIESHLAPKMVLDHLFLELREAFRTGGSENRSFMDLSVQI